MTQSPSEHEAPATKPKRAKKPKEPQPPAPPKAAIKRLAALHDEALALYQTTVRPWLLEMEAWDRSQNRPISAVKREAMRDDLTNRLHEGHERTRHLRDRVQDGSLLRPQASPCDERDEDAI